MSLDVKWVACGVVQCHVRCKRGLPIVDRLKASQLTSRTTPEWMSVEENGDKCKDRRESAERRSSSDDGPFGSRGVCRVMQGYSLPHKTWSVPDQDPTRLPWPLGANTDNSMRDSVENTILKSIYLGIHRARCMHSFISMAYIGLNSDVLQSDISNLPVNVLTIRRN